MLGHECKQGRIDDHLRGIHVERLVAKAAFDGCTSTEDDVPRQCEVRQTQASHVGIRVEAAGNDHANKEDGEQ